MKAIGIVGSPRKNGNTEFITKHILKAIEEEGIEVELIRLAGLDIKPCIGCMTCTDGEECSQDDDVFPIYTKMKAADAIVITTPVYIGSATALVKAFMERAGFMARNNGRLFAGKVGGPFVVSRRSAHFFTVAQLYFWFHMQGFFMPGSIHPNIAFGGDEKGEVEKDEEGLATAWNFGKNIAFLTKKLKA